MQEHQKGRAVASARTPPIDAEKYLPDYIRDPLSVPSSAPAGFGELEYALCSKDHEKARSLISSGYDPRTISASNSYPMAIAACCESIESVAMLTSYCADFEPPAQYLQPPLSFSLDCSNDKVALFLIEHGADVDHSYGDEEKPLLKAALARNLEIAIAILNAGADPNVLDSSGKSCLQYFAATGSKDCLSALSPYYTISELFNATRLRSGASNAVKALSLIPLAVGLRIGSKRTLKRKQKQIEESSVVAELKKLGGIDNVEAALKNLSLITIISSELHARNSGLEPCLRSAYMSYDQRFRSCLDKNETQQYYALLTSLIVESYGHTQYRDPSSRSSILHIAIGLDIEILTKRLLKEERFTVLINTSNNLLDRPLHIATRLNLQWAIDLLLSAGADVNPCNRAGLTPLHIAIINQNIPSVKSLLSKHANAYLTPRNNREADAAIKSVLASNQAIKELIETSMVKARSTSIFSKNNPLSPLVRNRTR